MARPGRRGYQPSLGDASFTAADLKGAERGVIAAEAQMHSAVVAARAEGWSWNRIGRVLGLPGETMRRRHAPPDVADLEA